MRFDVRREVRIAELQYQLPPREPSDGMRNRVVSFALPLSVVAKVGG